jgi:hypothetical protein
MSQYGDDDGEPIVRRDDAYRNARKPHKCSACGETIAAGRTYHRTAALWGGTWQVVRRCERCQAIFLHLEKKIDAEGASEEFCDWELNCGHEYRERWGESPPEVIAALAFWLPGDPLP